MQYFDVTLPTSEENLACDEALLDLVEEGTEDEILRLWESDRYFVVLGSSSKVKEEVNEEACARDGIPVLRRHSGGGTVLQGPGCLNFSLILKIDPAGLTRNITETTNFIMQRHAKTLTDLLGEKVEMKGSSDLTIDGMKFSGNAQRRRLNAVLFHGTFLYDFDLEKIARYLKQPPKQPDYRRQRNHLEFVRNIHCTSEALKKELRSAWDANHLFEPLPGERIKKLVEEKYSRREWNYRL